jgi:poly(3-hydroxybutyrate) depolymerase
MKIYNNQAIFYLLFLPINSLSMSLMIDFHGCKKSLANKNIKSIQGSFLIANPCPFLYIY